VNGIFQSALNMSLTGAFIIAVIMLARLPLKKAPKWISYCLWAVAAFRLAVPFTLTGLFSLLPFEAEPLPPGIADKTLLIEPFEQTPALLLADSETAALHSQSLSPQAAALYVRPVRDILSLCGYIWLAGIAAMLLYSLITTIALRRKLRFSMPLGGHVYETDTIRTPLVFGVFCPKIYLPADLTEHERAYILLHEQTHIKRRDYLVKIFAFCLLCVHWYNPFVWAAFLLMTTDMEMSCDERVMRAFGGDIKIDYSTSLVRLAARPRFIGASPLAFGEGGLKERVKRVLRFKKPNRIVVTAAAAFVALLTVGLAVNRTADNNADTAAENNEWKYLDISREIDDGALTGTADTPVFSTQQEADAYAFLDAVARGEDPTGDGNTAALLRQAFDGQTPHIENIRKRENTDKQFLCDIKLDRIYEPWTLTLLLDYQSGSLRYFCWYTYYYEQARSVITRYLAALESGDVRQIAEALTPDGPAADALDKAEAVLDFYRQYDLEALTLASFGFDDDTTQFVCLVQSLNGGTFEIRLHCMDGLVGPDIWEATHTLGPEDIHDLVSAKLSIAQGFAITLDDTSALRALESLLGRNASEETFPTKCPFYYPLELTRADGTVGIVYPALDSCGVFKSGSHYYNYGGGKDNADFWALFGGNPAPLERGYDEGNKPFLTIADVRRLAEESKESAFQHLSNYYSDDVINLYDRHTRQWTYPIEGGQWQLDVFVSETNNAETLTMYLNPIGFSFQPEGGMALEKGDIGAYIDFVENYVSAVLTDEEIASARDVAFAHWSRLFAGKLTKDDVIHVAHIDGQFAGAVVVSRVKGKLAAFAGHIDGMQRHIILTQAETGAWEVINEGI
jgi:beta-lactamase regulating signal transducer with metallopeptidase domain